MNRLVLTAAAIGLLGAAVAAGPAKATPLPASYFAFQNRNDRQPQIQTFMGTITKTGELFVFSEDATHASYRLDDQKTAEKFAGEKVKVTGTLDAANNTIRVQSIAATA
jgi:Protein of unknown function (DUF5818)